MTGKMTAKIILSVGEGVHCYSLPEGAKAKIRKDLTLDNPKYVSAKKNGRFIPASLSAKLYFYVEDYENGDFWIPRGYIYYLKRWLCKNNYKTTIENRTILFPKIKIKFNGQLRPYQKPAVDTIVNRYPVGVLEASTGAGKTVMGCAIIAERKQPTLIIVHTKELLYQWRDSIKKFLNYDCGLVGDGKYEVKDITVGIVNTVRNKTEELRTQFGQIIIDECHRIASTLFTETVSEFPARHYLGLSATPYRNDGLGYAIDAYIGPRLYKVDKDALHKVGAVLVPDIHRIRTNFRYMFKSDYSSMISELCKDNERNKLISNHIRYDLNLYSQNVLVVSDRVTHAREIAKYLKIIGVDSRILSGKECGEMTFRYEYDKNGSQYKNWFLEKMNRSDVVDDIKAGKVKVTIATLSLVSEGFDVPNLSALFLTTPIKFSGRLLQVIGRILRPSKGAKPRVYDFRDVNVTVLKNSGFNRDKIYKAQWC